MEISGTSSARQTYVAQSKSLHDGGTQTAPLRQPLQRECLLLHHLRSDQFDGRDRDAVVIWAGRQNACGSRIRQNQ
jgi:hypothetical protein